MLCLDGTARVGRRRGCRDNEAAWSAHAICVFVCLQVGLRRCRRQGEGLFVRAQLGVAGKGSWRLRCHFRDRRF